MSILKMTISFSGIIDVDFSDRKYASQENSKMGLSPEKAPNFLIILTFLRSELKKKRFLDHDNPGKV